MIRLLSYLKAMRYVLVSSVACELARGIPHRAKNKDTPREVGGELACLLFSDAFVRGGASVDG